MIVTGDKGECLTLMLIALSSTNNTVSLLGCFSSGSDSSADCSAERSGGASASGVWTEEASMKLVGVMRELRVRVFAFTGRSKYESPEMVKGNGSRVRL